MQRRQGMCAKWMVLVFLLVFAVAAAAQENKAALSGRVTDPQGGGVNSLKVTATNLATGVERSTTTDENGHYDFIRVDPCTYKLAGDGGENFQSDNWNIDVTVAEKARLNFQLNVKSLPQSIVVNTEVSNIENTR